MKKNLPKILLFCVACGAVGWAFVSFAPVLSAGSAESATWIWPVVFTAPVLVLLLGWLMVRTRAHFGGDQSAGRTLSGFKAGCLVLALPVFYGVYVATQRRIDHERAEVLRTTGFVDSEISRYGSLPRARDPLRAGDGGDERIHGKLFVYDPAKSEASPIHFRLSAKLAPSSPAEVGTVACMGEWVRDSSNRWQRAVRLIELESGEVACYRWFLRDDADAQVLRWLESLPQTGRSPAVAPAAGGRSDGRE